MLIIVALGAIFAIWQIVRHTPLESYSAKDTDLWGVMERDPSWDHDLSCRCRTCRS